ncbi:MAG TPA: ATP-binding protein [Virgibacillus sp.]|nr:ATP-binding protein [Virgibacillus sp.]
MSKKKNEIEHDHTQVTENGRDNYYLHLADLPRSILDWVDQHSHEVVAVWDKSGKLLFISKSVLPILGYKPTELHGISWAKLISSSDKQYIQQHVTITENKKHTVNLNIRNNQGKYIWFESTITKIISNSNDGSYYYISSLKDITNKKEAEEMMVRSEKMSIAGQLAAGIAHEIRNPLTSLKGFLQLLKAGVDAKDAYYKIMIDELNKIETITSELLFISKPMTNNKEPESIQSMITDVIALLQPQARLHNIDLRRECVQDYYIHCDRSQIKQVLINIIKNAIEAVEPYATITIKVRECNHLIEIDIIDEGPGIPEDIVHKLSEPFFTTKQSGTGLGLMITQQILEQHDGHIKILQNQDKGSTFRIILPIHDIAKS